MTGAGRVKPSASLEMASSLTLGTGALIGIERGARCMQALLDEAWAVGATFSVPSGVLAQAWSGTPQQARLARFLGLPNVAVVPLDDAELGRLASCVAVAVSTTLSMRRSSSVRGWRTIR
jgi:hypothetical protein